MDRRAARRSLRSAVGDGPRSIVAMRPLAVDVALSVARPTDDVVVDFEDVESAKANRRRAVLREGASRWEQLRDAIDERCWRRFERDVTSRADLVTVCSGADRSALGAGEIVPNGTVVPDHAPESHHGTEPRPLPASLLFLGQLTYGPNADAAIRLASEILPRVRRTFPDASLRLVGNTSEQVRQLAALDGVVVTGYVGDLSGELAQASVLVVPLRWGSGTRIKILDAFAHRVPVVSTTIGADGLDVCDGTHLLIGDTDDEIAARVVEVLDDRDAATLRAEAALGLVRDRYTWTEAERRFAELARVREPAPLGRSRSRGRPG